MSTWRCLILKGSIHVTWDKFVSGKDIEYEIVDSVYNDKLPKGWVGLERGRKPAATVKQGRTIYLTVNARVNKKVAMPRSIDLSLRQAKSLLESMACK